MGSVTPSYIDKLKYKLYQRKCAILFSYKVVKSLIKTYDDELIGG